MSGKKLIGTVLVVTTAALIFIFTKSSNGNQSAQPSVSTAPTAQLSNVQPSAEQANDQPAIQQITKAETTVEQKQQRVIVLTDEKRRELEGNTNNEYGIRQDILQFIEENVLKDNPKAFEAAIKLAQYNNQLLYHAKNQQEALVAVRKFSLASRCLVLALPKNRNKYVNGVRIKPEWQIIFDGVSNPMRNTSAREAHSSSIEELYLSGNLIGSGLGSDEEEERCATGNF